MAGQGCFAFSRVTEFKCLAGNVFRDSRDPVMVQQYLPDVRAGDKRIILINGDAKGAINRVPQEGEARSNLHVGGSAQAVELTKGIEICAIIG